MGRRLILDTGVLVAAERGRILMSSVVEDSDDTALPAITITELRVGVLRAAAAQRASRQVVFDRVRAAYPIIDYNPQITQSHAELLAHTRAGGKPRSSFDLIIAATARATGRTLVTFDKRAAFSDLPEVNTVEL